MVCLRVQRDKPRVLADYLPYRRTKHGITILYCEILRAKVGVFGTGDINF